MKLNQTLILIPLVMLISSCGNKSEEQETKIETGNVPTVLVANPQKHEFNSSLQISGTAKPNQQVKLFAMTNGMLSQLNADIGYFVKEGQILAVLENPELIQQKEKVEAELKAKKSNYERLKNVYDKTPQLTTVAEVEKAEADYEGSKAQLNGLQSQISFLQVKAPFSGIITNRLADKGSIIQSGLNNSSAMPLFEIQDLQPIRLTIEIPESDAALIEKNTKVEINFPELPNGKFSATVTRIAYGLDENTRTMKIEIDLPNTDLKIRSGMYANVEIKRGGHKDVLSVPNEAIGNVKGQSFVYVVENNVCKKMEIKIGIRDEKFTEILSGEIRETDQVVIQGKELCSNGSTVKIKK